MKIKLKKLREKENLSLNKLKKILKDKYNFSVSDSQLMYYENEIRKPRDEKIWTHLADYFGVSVGYLLGYNDEIMTFDSGEEFEKEKMRTLNTIFLSELQKSQEKDAIQIDVLAAIKFLESALEKLKKHSRNVKNSYITDLQKALDTLSNIADGLAGKNGSNDK